MLKNVGELLFVNSQPNKLTKGASVLQFETLPVGGFNFSNLRDLVVLVTNLCIYNLPLCFFTMVSEPWQIKLKCYNCSFIWMIKILKMLEFVTATVLTGGLDDKVTF